MPQEVFGMIDSHELKKRDIYLKKLIGFRDTAAITTQRRDRARIH